MFIETSFITLKYFQNLILTKFICVKKVTASKHFLAAQLPLFVSTIHYTTTTQQFEPFQGETR
jgi:hypothetical protein